MGLVGPVDLEGQVDSLASLQVGLGAWEGSEGASPEGLEVGCLVAPEGRHPVGLGVDHLEGPKEVIQQSRWLVVAIWGGGRWPRRRVVNRIGMEVLAEIKHWGRLAGRDLRLSME